MVKEDISPVELVKIVLVKLPNGETNFGFTWTDKISKLMLIGLLEEAKRLIISNNGGNLSEI